MDKIAKSVQEYVKSGEYFADAKKWYNFKHLYPLAQKSWLLICACILAFLLAIVVLGFTVLLPIKQKIQYSLYTPNLTSSVAVITQANEIKNNPRASIADIMVRGYIKHREQFDYERLKEQFVYMQNNSTKVIFRKFYNYMSIDNPDSPIMRYQKHIRRSVNFESVTYPEEGLALVVFQSIAKSSSGEVVENALWQAKIGYEIDPISLKMPQGSRFRFVVVDYQIKLLEDKIKK